MKIRLYNKLIKSILKGLNESGLFTDIDLSSDESTEDELNISDNLKVEYVDLGLPSGTLWCSHNVGAETPEEYGDYLDWYEANEKYTLPTTRLFYELRDNCKWEWTTLNNVNGYKVTGPNNNSIFLPAAGSKYGTKYPTSTIVDLGTIGLYIASTVIWQMAGTLYFKDKYINPHDSHTRYNYAFSVRLVKNNKIKI